MNNFKSLICTVSIIGIGVGWSFSAPLDQYFDTPANDVMESSERLQLLQDLGDLVPNLGNLEKDGDDSTPNFSHNSANKEAGYWHNLPQKRLRPFKYQTRAVLTKRAAFHETEVALLSVSGRCAQQLHGWFPSGDEIILTP